MFYFFLVVPVMACSADVSKEDAFKVAEKRYRRQKARSFDDPLFKDALDCSRLVRPPRRLARAPRAQFSSYPVHGAARTRDPSGPAMWWTCPPSTPGDACWHAPASSPSAPAPVRPPRRTTGQFSPLAVARSGALTRRGLPATGFLLATNPFTADQQRLWCSRCMLGYVHDANQSNVHALFGPVLDGLWPAACRGETLQRRRRRPLPQPLQGPHPAAPGGVGGAHITAAPPCGSSVGGGGPGDGCPPEGGREPPLAARTLLNKVRWLTLGHHYDWTRRQYPPGAVTPFPADAAALTAAVAAELGLALRPEAAIVNFYRPSSTMGGHRDDLEGTFEHPVVSVSFGLPCLFLLGGRDRSQEPVPLFVRSGDILVLSGESRLAVHGARPVPAACSQVPSHARAHAGVPVIFNHSCPRHLTGDANGACDVEGAGAREEGRGAAELWPHSAPLPHALSEEAHAAHLSAFMARTRVNLNVRQVWPDE